MKVRSEFSSSRETLDRKREKMKKYKYAYIAIPTINGEIVGSPKIRFFNILENDYLEMLKIFDLDSAVIYVVSILRS